MSSSTSTLLCPTCRRMFPHKKALNRHCCSSVGLTNVLPVALNGKRKNVKSPSNPEKKKKADGDSWTAEEEATLQLGVEEFGTNWTLILYKYGSRFHLIHQQPGVLETKWSEVQARQQSSVEAVVKVEVSQTEPEEPVDTKAAEEKASVSLTEIKADKDEAEQLDPGRPRYKLMIISKGGRKSARPNRDDDDEDYVPELGADSDSDCSDIGGEAEVEAEIVEEDEEILEFEEEEEEVEEVIEEEGAELTISTVDGSGNAVFTTTVVPVSAVCASTSSSESTTTPETASFPNDVSQSTASSMFAPTYLYLADAGSVAFPISSVPLASSCSSSSVLPPSAYVAVPASHCATPTVVSVSPDGAASSSPPQSNHSSSESSMALPSEFHNLLLSKEFQRLLNVPVTDLLSPGTRGQDLLVQVLFELARILATLYPGSRSSGPASKFLDTVCVPWIRSFLPHFLSHSDLNIIFEGESEPRPLLSGIQAKVKRLFLFYLNVLPQNSSVTATPTVVMTPHHRI